MDIVNINGLTTIDSSLVMTANIDMSRNSITDLSNITFIDGTQFIPTTTFEISNNSGVTFNTPEVTVDNSLVVTGKSDFNNCVSISGEFPCCNELVDVSNLALSVKNGVEIKGPIMQLENESLVKLPKQINGTVYHENTNIFSGKKHIFIDDISNNLSKTDVIIMEH